MSFFTPNRHRIVVISVFAFFAPIIFEAWYSAERAWSLQNAAAHRGGDIYAMVCQADAIRAVVIDGACG
jgi:hypothetical protein